MRFEFKLLKEIKEEKNKRIDKKLNLILIIERKEKMVRQRGFEPPHH